MIARNVDQSDLEKALFNLNQKYENNIVWNRFERKGNGYAFTLRVISSKGRGAKRGFSGRKTIHACWHVHGDFFDFLFKINPRAYVWSAGNKITKDYGNWEDRNIGSIVSPLMYSDSCECKSIQNQEVA